MPGYVLLSKRSPNPWGARPAGWSSTSGSTVDAPGPGSLDQRVEGTSRKRCPHFAVSQHALHGTVCHQVCLRVAIAVGRWAVAAHQQQPACEIGIRLHEPDAFSGCHFDRSFGRTPRHWPIFRPYADRTESSQRTAGPRTSRTTVGSPAMGASEISVTSPSPQSRNPSSTWAIGSDIWNGNDAGHRSVMRPSRTKRFPCFPKLPRLRYPLELDVGTHQIVRHLHRRHPHPRVRRRCMHELHETQQVVLPTIGGCVRSVIDKVAGKPGAQRRGRASLKRGVELKKNERAACRTGPSPADSATDGPRTNCPAASAAWADTASSRTNNSEAACLPQPNGPLGIRMLLVASISVFAFQRRCTHE